MLDTAAAAATAGREGGGVPRLPSSGPTRGVHVYQCLFEVMTPAYYGVSPKSPGSGGGFRSLLTRQQAEQPIQDHTRWARH